MDYFILPMVLCPNPTLPSLAIIKAIPTERATTAVAASEPAKQARTMEHILAGATPLVRRLHIRTDHRIADGALALSLKRALYVLPEGYQAISQVSMEHDDALNGEQPRSPLLLVDNDSLTADNRGGLQRVGWG